ncbi:MAG: hypothetical protein HQK52_18070 [Oligoflexia bacterium]|nr:hypothetical protein [Oligoflexia bacterium]
MLALGIFAFMWANS